MDEGGGVRIRSANLGKIDGGLSPAIDDAEAGEAFRRLCDARQAVVQHLSGTIEDPTAAAQCEQRIWEIRRMEFGDGCPVEGLSDYLRIAGRVLQELGIEQLPPRLCAALAG